MIKCQVCGFDNKDDAQFCLNCGSPLAKQKLSEAVDDVSEDATVMLDPDAMQKRLQAEFAEAQQQEAPPPSPPRAAAAATPPAPPPAPPAAPPPSPAAGQSAAPPPPVSAPPGAPQPRQFLITLVLCLVGILGIAGLHRFYTGKIGTGVLMLVRLGACGIWTLVDIIMIALDKFTDAEGRPLAR